MLAKHCCSIVRGAPESGSTRNDQERCASAGSLDITLAEPHPNSNTQQTKNKISQFGSSTTQSQTPEDGHINGRNMLSI